MRISEHLKFVILAFASSSALLFSAPSFAANDAVISEADRLIRQGNFSAAYQLLEPLETTRAGDINFDYLLGVSAVESGNATRGAFALERVLALDPNHKDARAEMAKAHFILGETDASKSEFSNVMQQNPDAETQIAIEKMLTSIRKLEGTATTYGAYLDFGLGWDSNVSSAPDLSSISLPFIGGLIVDLGGTGKAKSDGFFNLGGGASFRHPFSQQVAVFGAVSGSKRLNGSEHAFDTSVLDFNAGLDFKVNDTNNLIFSLQDNHFDLDGEAFRHAYGGSAQWLHNIDAYNQAGVYAQFSRLKFNGNEIRNADRKIVGINAGHAFQGDLKPILYASIYGGRENARSPLVDFLDQDIWGLRAGGQLSIDSQWQTFANFSYESRDHQAQDPAFLKERKDNQYDASVGLRYTPMRDLTIRPQFSYTKNDSNIDLDSFDRKMISISIRKDFNW